jgi:hypothetical protein
MALITALQNVMPDTKIVPYSKYSFADPITSASDNYLNDNYVQEYLEHSIKGRGIYCKDSRDLQKIFLVDLTRHYL